MRVRDLKDDFASDPGGGCLGCLFLITAVLTLGVAIRYLLVMLWR